LLCKNDDSDFKFWNSDDVLTDSYDDHLVQLQARRDLYISTSFFIPPCLNSEVETTFSAKYHHLRNDLYCYLKRSITFGRQSIVFNGSYKVETYSSGVTANKYRGVSRNGKFWKVQIQMGT
jgi:hypothetical protein